MIALIVIGVIISLILILLFLPITVDLVYDNSFLVKIKYFGIILFNYPKAKTIKQNKKTKEKTKVNSKPKKDNFLKTVYDQKGLLGSVEYFSNILEIILKKLWWIIKRFKFRRFKFDLIIATSDAANTAIKYGKICAAVYPVFSLLQSLVDFKPKTINISTDFDKSQSEFKISLLVKTSLLCCLTALVGGLTQFLKLQRKEREKYERKQYKDRDGYHDGQASHNG